MASMLLTPLLSMVVVSYFTQCVCTEHVERWTLSLHVLYINIFISTILATIENAISCVLLIGAIYRYYEIRRRIHNDSQPERLHAVYLMQKKARKVALHKQVYLYYIHFRSKGKASV